MDPSAKVDELALAVARRFTQDTECQRRASLQVAVVDAIREALRAAPPAVGAKLARKVLDLYHGAEYMRAREGNTFGASEADMRVEQMVSALTGAGIAPAEPQEVYCTCGRLVALPMPAFKFGPAPPTLTPGATDA